MTKTMRGTCPACFREMDVDNGRMHKHGWTETGGRRAGEYGNAFHSGSCFGVGYEPFEVSPEGTWAYLEQKLYPYALKVDNTLRYYEARPTILAEYAFTTGERDAYSRRKREHRTVELKPGAVVTVKTSAPYRNSDHCETCKFDYETHLANRLRNTERDLRWAKEDGVRAYAAADTWKPGKLKAKGAKGPTVHGVPKPRANGKRPFSGPYCGSRSYYVKTSEVDDEVTCSRCRKVIDRNKADAEKRAAAKADGEALTKWAEENEPATSKIIKAALGWDTKRFNKATDYSTVKSDYGRPARYMSADAYRAHIKEMHG